MKMKIRDFNDGRGSLGYAKPQRKGGVIIAVLPTSKGVIHIRFTIQRRVV